MRLCNHCCTSLRDLDATVAAAALACVAIGHRAKVASIFRSNFTHVRALGGMREVEEEGLGRHGNGGIRAVLPSVADFSHP